MKTRINLYLPHLRPVKEILPLNLFMSLSVITFILVVATIGGLNYMNNSMDESNHALKNTLRVKQSVFSDKTNELIVLTTNSPLLEDIKRIKVKINEKKKILATLNTEIKVNSGYSRLFTQLADIKNNNVWLTHIATHNGRLNFGGSALNSRDIPRWVNELESSDVLNGQKFSNLSIERNNNIVNFTLYNDSAFVVGEVE